jgi:hypothetical protein
LDTNILQVIGTVIFFIIIYISGYRLKRTGKPYNSITFNIHKLISLAVIAFLIVKIYNINQVSEITLAEWVIIIITGFLFIIAIVSGGLRSIDKSASEVIPIIHKVTSFLTVFATAVLLYFLFMHY